MGKENFFKNKKIPLLVGLFGLGLLIVGVALKGTTSELYYLISVELGIAGIIVALAETFILKSATKEMEKLVTESSDKIKISVEETFPIIKQAERSGIESIFGPRYRVIQKKEKRQATETIKKIGEYVRIYVETPKIDEKVLRICGISCKDFFSIGGVLNQILLEIVNKEIELPTKLSIQALIMNKFSISARERAQVEHGAKLGEFRLQKTIVYKDLTDSYEGIKHLLERIEKNPVPNLEIKIKLFHLLPEAYIIMSNEFLFIEQYHMGRPKEYDGYFCVGGLVPVFKYRRDSDMYAYIERQFELIWNSDVTQFFKVIPFEDTMIISTKDNIYHRVECKNIEDIEPEDIECISKKQAIAKNYKACNRCLP